MKELSCNYFVLLADLDRKPGSPVRFTCLWDRAEYILSIAPINSQQLPVAACTELS